MSAESDAVAAMYDATADVYRERVFAERVLYKDVVTAWLREVKPRRLLDVGCGPWLFWSELPDESEVVGVDVSSRMLDLAAQARPSGEYHRRDFHEPIPEAWGRVDAVLAVGCFELCRDLTGVVSNLAAAAQPGAKVLFTVAARAPGGPARESLPADGPAAFLYFHTEEEVRRSVAGAGLDLEVLDRQLAGCSGAGRSVSVR